MQQGETRVEEYCADRLWLFNRHIDRSPILRHLGYAYLLIGSCFNVGSFTCLFRQVSASHSTSVLCVDGTHRHSSYIDCCVLVTIHDHAAFLTDKRALTQLQVLLHVCAS